VPVVAPRIGSPRRCPKGKHLPSSANCPPS
jgi:hypothetical protein